ERAAFHRADADVPRAAVVPIVVVVEVQSERTGSLCHKGSAFAKLEAASTNLTDERKPNETRALRPCRRRSRAIPKRRAVVGVHRPVGIRRCTVQIQSYTARGLIRVRLPRYDVAERLAVRSGSRHVYTGRLLWRRRDADAR